MNNNNDMAKKKKDYEAPEISRVSIELENAICAGSVDFHTGTQGVTIKNQDFANDGTNADGTPVNDFSSTSWDIEE